MTGSDCCETRSVLDGLGSARRLRIAAEVREVEYLAALAADPDPYRDGSGELGKHWIVEDVACVLRVPSVVAAQRLHVANQLVSRFTATYAAMQECRLDLRMATRLVESAEQLPGRALAGFEAEALEGVECRTFAQFSARVRRAVLRADPRGADEQHEAQRGQRRVVFTPVEHGMTELWALLPADRAAALAAEVQRRAQLAEGDDDRTADQRRADALCDIFTGGTGAQVNVTVPLSTLLGTSDQPGDEPCGPGELDGYGPIAPELARRLAFDPTGTWRRLLTDPAGNLVDVSSTRYRPPAPMQRFVELRDGTCRFPTCRRRAAACELDHVTPWAAGGETEPANLIPLCSRHHHTKHDGHWQVQRLPDGTVHWTSPTGHTYDRPPPDPLAA